MKWVAHNKENAGDPPIFIKFATVENQISSDPNPVLVTLTRNGLVESVHRGALCVVNDQNEIVFSLGDVHRLTYTRSAMKFIQVLPLIESGAADFFGLAPEEIAVICASHNGEEKHIEVVQSILSKGGISPNALGCGIHQPFYGPASDALTAAGKLSNALHNNCSGKHSGFLLLSKFLGAPMDSYLDSQHPVQKMVRKVAAEMYELQESEMHPGVDGCSAPNFAIPLINHAIGFRNLMHPKQENSIRESACKKVVAAITAFPFMVAGTGRYCSDLMRETRGAVIGKVGAEGVYGMATANEKLGIAIKMDDGTMGPQYNVAQALLEKLKVISPETAKALKHYKIQEIFNFSKKHTGTRSCIF